MKFRICGNVNESDEAVVIDNLAIQQAVTAGPCPTANAGSDQTGAATCDQTSVILAANAPSSGTGAWSIVSGTGGSFGNTASPTSTFSGTAGSTYTLRWTVSDLPCAASTDDVVITFNQNPTAANAGPDQTGAATCGQTSVTLAANAPSIGTGAWSVVSGTGGAFGNTASPTSTFSGTAGSTYTLRWTVTNAPCNPTTDDVVITFNKTPSFSNCPGTTTVSITTGCSTTVTYDATTADINPATTVTYAFSGATAITGNGTGSGSAFNIGTSAVMLIASNDCGTSNCSFLVVVQAPEVNLRGNSTDIADGDNTPSSGDHTDLGQTTGAPIVRTFTVQNKGAANLNITGITLGGANPNQFSVGALSPPSPVAPNSSATFTVTYSSNVVGIQTATVNIANNDCNEGTYDFTVRGELTCSPPTFTVCPTATVEVNTPTNGCAATAIYNVFANGLPAPALTYAFSGATTGNGNGTGSGNAFNKGTTNVTVTATNPCGAPACTFSVRVTDNVPPSITCPTPMTVPNSPGQCGATVTYAPTLSDNCSGATFTVTSGLASGSVFPIGTTTLQLKATDAAGLTATCAFTIQVNDTELPSITCPANIVRSADAGQCSAVATYTNPTYSDNCSGAGLDHISGGTSGSAFLKGLTTVIWQATDASNNTKRCTFTVTVNDTQLPSITCPANQTVGTVTGQCYGTATYTVGYSDNCPEGGAVIQSGIPSGGNFPKGQTTVVWRATDGAGLTRTCSFRVTVNDTEAPVITCPASQSANTAPNLCTANVTYATPTATDNCPGAVTVVRVGGPASGSSFPQGSTNVTWRAIDGAGRSSTCSFSVTVTDAQAPVVTCPGNIAVTGGGSPCTAVATYATPTATDNCGVQSVFLLSGQLSGSIFPAGATVNTWRAVDANGLSSTCSFTVTVGCGAASEQGGVSREPLALGVASETSGAELKTLNFNLWPNPAVSEVQILVESFGSEALTSGGELTVLDAQGRLMWQQRVELSAVSRQSSAVSLTDFPAGVYFVTLRAEGHAVTKRLVVQRL